MDSTGPAADDAHAKQYDAISQSSVEYFCQGVGTLVKSKFKSRFNNFWRFDPTTRRFDFSPLNAI